MIGQQVEYVAMLLGIWQKWSELWQLLHDCFLATANARGTI